MTAIYHWEAAGTALPKFERRTTLCSARNEESAEALLLKEAEEYQTEIIKMLDSYVIQKLDDPPSSEPVEIAHEMTIGVDLDSGRRIEPDEFILRHWSASRIKSCDAFGVEHSWHNRDGVTIACHNCEEVREGRLWESNEETKPEEPQS